jgi:hypothetical protein
MSKVIYLSPTGEFSIQEIKFDMKWYNLLAERIEAPASRYYGICKKINDEWAIYRIPEPPTIPECFLWLFSRQIISRDEFHKNVGS